MKIFQKKKKSFTMVELIMAVFILGVGLLGIATFYAYSFKIAKMAQSETTASNLASGILDEQLSNSYDNLAVSSGSKVPYSEVVGNPFTNYQKQIAISCIDANLIDTACTNAHMKKVVVTVYWTDNTTERSFQIASIKAEH